MIYYQVTDRLAQVNGRIFAPGELFTEKEMDKSKYRKANKEFFVMREIKKSKVYWSFGVRKEIKGGIVMKVNKPGLKFIGLKKCSGDTVNWAAGSGCENQIFYAAMQQLADWAKSAVEQEEIMRGRAVTNLKKQ